MFEAKVWRLVRASWANRGRPQPERLTQPRAGRISKIDVFCDTLVIFGARGMHWRRQWQYLVVRSAIFTERVVIFGARANPAWICGGASPPQPGPAKIFRRLLHPIFARVLTFFNRFSEMGLPGRAASLTSYFLLPSADLQKCEKLMVKRRFFKRAVQNCDRGAKF